MHNVYLVQNMLFKAADRFTLKYKNYERMLQLCRNNYVSLINNMISVVFAF